MLFLKNTLSLIVMLALAAACQTNKLPTQMNSDEQLSFGYGGGLTGQVDTYVLQENGQLHSTNSLTKEEKQLPALSPEETEQLFRQAKAVTAEYSDLNQPGNRYYFIRFQSGDSTRSVTWGKPGIPVPKPVEDLYQSLTLKVSSE